MLFPLDDVIAAPGAASGGAARGVVRIGGPDVVGLLTRLGLPVEPKRSRPWSRATTIPVAAGSMQIDVPVELSVWPSHRSYIGQPLAELHLPGSPPVVEAVLAACYQAGARQAERGEFTLRAFLSGKIDLTQAEAVLGVIEAESQSELTAALSQLSGGLAREIESTRDLLLDLLADLEAGLDFVDEHLEFVSHDVLIHRLDEAGRAVDALRTRSGTRLQSNPVPVVVLAGKPNAGKSTLFNRLAGRDVALVSSDQGTTRDYLEIGLDIEGRAMTLVDTAGWEKSDPGQNPVQVSAQRFRDAQWARADLILVCVSADEPDWQRSANELLARVPTTSRPRTLLLRTRCDLRPDAEIHAAAEATDADVLPVSGTTGAGLERLCSEIVSRLSESSRGGDSLVATTAARCRESLDAARAALDRATAIATSEVDQELLAIEIRDTLDALGRLVGAVHTDDLLDRIFSRFCIGK